MDYIQNVQPNIHVPGTSGMCLQYVDDGVNAPNRKWSAQASWDYAVSIGKAHAEEPPKKVWVPVYYTIDNGDFAGLGHVAWYYDDGNKVVIYDSEYASGRRSVPYSSGSELISYMGWSMRYLGWSEHLDGLDIVKSKPAEKPKPPKPIEKKEEEMILVKTEKNYYVLTNDGKYTFVPNDFTKDAFSKVLPRIDINDVDMRNMFKKLLD